MGYSRDQFKRLVRGWQLLPERRIRIVRRRLMFLSKRYPWPVCKQCRRQMVLYLPNWFKTIWDKRFGKERVIFMGQRFFKREYCDHCRPYTGDKRGRLVGELDLPIIECEENDVDEEK